jgi:hypothetical protein
VNALWLSLETCNRLLRDEASAVATYDLALDKFRRSPDRQILKRIRSDHQESLLSLEESIVAAGGLPETSFGPWEGFGQVLEAPGNQLERSTAIDLLKRGEEHEMSDYEQALADVRISEGVKAIIRQNLLPPIKRHLDALESIALSNP